MEFQQKHNNLNAMKKIIGSIIFFNIFFNQTYNFH